MRTCILPTLVGLFLIIPAATQASANDGAIPQDEEKQERRHADALAWQRRTLVEAYDKVGAKDARWDKPARAAMEAAARFLSKQCDPVTPVEEIYQPAKQAIDAGCRDPLILYLYARSSYNPNFPGQDELERRFRAAAKAMESSAYSPLRRAAALMKAVQVATERDNLAPDARKEVNRQIDVMLALLPKSVAEDERNAVTEQLWLEIVLEAIRAHRRLSGDQKAGYDRVDAFLAKHPSLKLLRLQARGSFLISHAWEARGRGLANTVSEQGGKQFQERLMQAQKTLEEAWKINPGDERAATMMLIVEKGIGGKRDNMERWFERAMKANGDNRTACELKLDWLDPKWHGAEEEFMAFGRACRDTKNWRAGITLLVVDAHRRHVERLPDEPSRKAYWRNEAIWKEVNAVYGEYLQHYPNDIPERNRYAGYCALCARNAEAHEQYQLIGDNLVYYPYFPENWVKQVKEYVARKAKQP